MGLFVDFLLAGFVVPSLQFWALARIQGAPAGFDVLGLSVFTWHLSIGALVVAFAIERLVRVVGTDWAKRNETWWISGALPALRSYLVLLVLWMEIRHRVFAEPFLWALPPALTYGVVRLATTAMWSRSFRRGSAGIAQSEVTAPSLP